MQVYLYPKSSDWQDVLGRPTQSIQDLETTVSDIFEDIRIHGDLSVRKYTEMYDKVSVDKLDVSRDEIVQAHALLNDELKQAISIAIDNITLFHKAQCITPQEIETTSGVVCWRKSIAIDKVGLYVPGGTAPLFSSVLMLGIPAKIAGCKDVILCTPPNLEGNIHPAILYVADKVGISQIFKVGGIQAIGAMAIGTKTIPSVYKLFGPGNQYVTAAKQVATQMGVAIDMPAGPSEVLIVSDSTGNPSFIAADLLSQAEHGTDSQALFITTEPELIEKVEKEVEIQLADLPRKDIAAKSLKHSKLVLLSDITEAINFINAYAPEHLIAILDKSSEQHLLDKLTNAGSVFLGSYTPESAGDYASGTNHTLPTDGYARAYSGVSLDSFVKKITFQRIDEQGIKNIGPAIETMAEAEELYAHKNAVTIRLNSLK